MKQLDEKLIEQAKKTKGYLSKKSSGYFASWQKRYFIIFQNRFCSFLDQTLQVEKKSIELIDMLSIEAQGSDQFIIKTKNRPFQFKSSTEDDRDLWMASLTLLKDFCRKKQQEKLKEVQKKKQEIGPKRKNISKMKNPQKKMVAQKYQNNFKISQETQKLKLQKNQTELMIFFSKIGLNKMIHRLKEDSIKKRIIFIHDKNGYYFSVSSKSVYDGMVDEFLLRQETIAPYQINVLYFIEKQFQQKSLVQVCKYNQILECALFENYSIRILIDCKKSVEIQYFFAQQTEYIQTLSLLNKATEIGKQFWNQNGRLQKNIDLFLFKYRESEQNQQLFAKMVQIQFNFAISNAPNKPDLINSNQFLKSQATLKFFPEFDSISTALYKFITACIIKSPPEKQVRQKFIKIYHRLVYSYLNKKWFILCTVLKDHQLIELANKVFTYTQIIQKDLADQRMKEGCRVLVKIVLRNCKNEVYQNIQKMDMNQESLRIQKSIPYKQNDSSQKLITIFVSSILDSFSNSLSTKMYLLSKIQKDQKIIIMVWEYFQSVSKKILQKMSNLIEFCNEKSTLISVCNSSKLFKKLILVELYKKLEKTPLFSMKKIKEQFLRQLQIELNHCQTICIKKLFIITFSSIDRNLLKNDFQVMNFQQICRQVIQKIQKLDNILPDVKVSMYEAAFEEVCFFFYTCIVKQNNIKNKPKQLYIKIVSTGVKDINQEFNQHISQDKIHHLLRDISLLVKFLTCTQNSLKTQTRQLKKIFGTSFSEGNLRNLISMRVNNIKQRQFLYQDCREQVKSSYNSNQEMESFQRESFFNSSYRRQRKSTLTQSLNSYCQQQQKPDKYKQKTQKNLILGLSNVIKEGYLYRKNLVKNGNNFYGKFFFRIIKDKIFQYQTQNSQQSVNCYLLDQLKKIYPFPEKNNIIVLEFQHQMIRMKAISNQEALHWIQKVYQAMNSDKAFSPSKDQIGSFEQALFEDFSGQKKLFSTKQTKQSFLSLTPKKSQLRKKYISPQKKSQTTQKQTNNKQSKRQGPQQKTKPSYSKQKKAGGCGGCSFFF